MILFCIEYRNIFTDSKCNNVVLTLLLIIFKTHCRNVISRMETKNKNKLTLRTVNQKIVVFLLIMLSYIPFWLLYLKSNLLYYLIEYVVHYRKKVVDANLANAFPEKSKEERDTIRKKYYRHFCDLSLETMKQYSIRESEMDKRMKFKNLDILEKVAEEGKGLIVLAMHYNNWEWGSYMQKKFKHPILGVYNRMRDNVPFDDFLLHARSQWGGVGVVMSSAARTAIDYKRRNVPAILWLAADQSAPPDAQFWTTFMHREAPFFAGPVKLAQKLNQPVFFQHTRKTGRGRYEIGFSLLFEEPAKVDASEILLAYVKKMEEVIREEPEFYLWSHRRWKHKRPEGTKLIV